MTAAVRMTAGTAWARKVSPVAAPMSAASRHRAGPTLRWISQAVAKKNACAMLGANGQGV